MRHKWKILWTILLAGWIVFIFANSMQVAEESAGRSGRALELIDGVLGTVGISWRPTEHLIRKAAHFAEYAALGILAITSMRRFGTEGMRHIVIAAVICVLVPVADETIQYFIPGRSAQVSDVLLDCAGAFVGGLVTETVCRLSGKQKRKE